ncbi:uncharacterized protein LOC135986479 [Caloenas nicobarica]|uniref:uncharacterized protein LOC135986479 n=1 Tax=Caloenas nicobarica TaxID=187106 RepID=UPI0032B876BE
MGEQPRPRAAPSSTAAPGRDSPVQPEPWEDEEGSAESPRPGGWIPQQGELWRSSCGGEAASAKELPQEMEDKGPGGHSQADSSSELPRNQPSIGNVEELSRSLMDSLDIIAVCHDLMEELKETSQNRRTPALRKSKSREYPVCLQCRRCVTSSCPHCSEPEEQQDLPVLVIILHRLDMMMVKGKLVEMDLELNFELLIAGEPVYTWEKMQVLPDTDSETCYRDCDGSLPISLRGSKSSKAPHPVLKTPQGQMGPAGQDTWASPGQQPWTKRSDASSADLQPAGQGESLPTRVPTQARSPGDSETSQVSCPSLRAPGAPEGQTRPANKDTRAAPHLQLAGQGVSLPTMFPPEGLCRAGLEPLPPMGYKGLGQGLGLQCVQHSWATMTRNIGATLGYLCIAGSLEPTGIAEWEQIVQLDLQCRADALLRNMEVVV